MAIASLIERHRKVVLIAAIAGLSLVLAILGPTFTADSSSYVRGAVFRPPMVPTVIAILKFVLGESLALRALVAVQAALGLAASTWLASEICRWLQARRALPWAIVALGFPQLQAGRAVMSESLAYAALCAALVFAGRLLVGPRSRTTLLGLCAFTAALIATRAQFIFCVPLVAVIAIAYVARVDRSMRGRLTTVAAMLGVCIAAVAFQASYSLPRAGRMGALPFTGIQLVVLTSFISTPQEVDQVQDPDGRALAVAVRQRLEADGLLASSPTRMIPSLQMGQSYNLIAEAYLRKFDEMMAHRGITTASWDDLEDHFRPEDWVSLDHVTLSIARDTLRSAWPRFIILFLRNLFESTRYTGILAVFVAGLGVAGAIRSRFASTVSVVASVAAGLWLMNAAFVALVEPLQMRYSFYFDSLLLAVVVVACGLAVESGAASPSHTSSHQPASGGPNT